MNPSKQVKNPVADLLDATADAKQLLQSYANTDFASGTHTHILSDVEELVDALASKYDSSHVGTTANKLVQLTSAAKLPAVDGSLLTNIRDLKKLPARPVVSTVGNSLVSNNATQSFAASLISGINGVASLWKGVDGSQSAAMAAQVANVPSTANAVIIHEGSNDAITPISLSAHRANTLAAINAVLARGMTPIVVASAPRTGYALITAQYAIGTAILCEDNQILYADPWLELVSDDGEYRSGISDGTHPYNGVASIAGRRAAQILKGEMPNYQYPRGNAVYTGEMGNLLFLTDSNADGVPDGWSISGTSATVNSKGLSAASYPCRGNKFSISLSGTSGQVAEIRYPTLIPSSVSIGSVMRLVGMVSASSITGGVAVNVNMAHDGATVYGPTIGADQSNVPVGCELAKTASASVSVLISVYPVGASWTADVEISGFDLIDLARYRV